MWRNGSVIPAISYSGAYGLLTKSFSVLTMASVDFCMEVKYNSSVRKKNQDHIAPSFQCNVKHCSITKKKLILKKWQNAKLVYLLYKLLLTIEKENDKKTMSIQHHIQHCKQIHIIVHVIQQEQNISAVLALSITMIRTG